MRRGTFWRVYLHALLLLVLITVAIVAVGWAFGPPPRRGALERISGWAAAELAQVLHDPVALQARLEETSESLGSSLAIYGRDGRRLAVAGDDPPGPPPRRALRHPRPRFLREERIAVAPIGRPPQAVLVSKPPRWAGDWARPATALGAVLVALALGSIPLARSIASPLERLTATVRRFGSGDLDARTRSQGRHLRGEAGELATAFDEMADRIQLLIRSEKELLANVSHELRTPLTRIRIALELAEEGDESGRRYLREIETDLAELEKMIEDVLTTARLDLATSAGPGGTPPLRKIDFPGAELLDAATQRFTLLHPARTLQLDVAGELPVLHGDPGLLRRALGNLLDNAAKYSDEVVVLRAEPLAGSVAFEVRDKGIGIDQADLSRLFTPFFRTDRSRARGTGGVGLGLALTRRIVEAHGGRIAVSSRAGEGATFRVELPT